MTCLHQRLGCPFPLAGPLVAIILWMAGGCLLAPCPGSAAEPDPSSPQPPPAILPSPPAPSRARLLPPVPASEGGLPHHPAVGGAPELTAERVVQAVLTRNPSLPQMVAASQAAAARVPQVTSLDDPLFGTTLAPATLGSRADGYRLELSQRYPWPGKLPLRGLNAAAEASAVRRDVEGVRQQLIEGAQDAFYEYYLAERALEVNAEALRLLRDFRTNAETRYRTGLVPQQDVLQAEVELGRQRNRGIQLDRQRRVAVARLNTLLHLPPDLPLPPPPRAIAVEGELPDPVALRAQALAERLDLLALKDRLAAAQASLKLALLDYYPDFDVMAAYDAFWDFNEQRAQLGVRVNLPVRHAKRRAAIAEAQARITELQAQLARQADQANYEVQQTYEQWRESQRTVRLFDRDVLPAARQNVKAAQAAYLTGRIPFLSLIEAQRNLVELQDQYYAAAADFFRRRTALQRSLTGTPATAALPMPAERPLPGRPGAPLGMGR